MSSRNFRRFTRLRVAGFCQENGNLLSKVYLPPGSIAEGDTRRFSTYFLATLEFLLAALEYQNKFHGGEPLSSTISLTPCNAIHRLSPRSGHSTSARSPSATGTLKFNTGRYNIDYSTSFD